MDVRRGRPINLASESERSTFNVLPQRRDGSRTAGRRLHRAAPADLATRPTRLAERVRPIPLLLSTSMRLDRKRTAFVVIDPQIDFMSPKRRSIVGESATEENMVPNLVRLFEASKRSLSRSPPLLLSA
jgi:hypothetical protein